MRFEVSGEIPGAVVRERKSFFLFGLVPELEIDVREKCSNGVVAVEEETTFVDGVFALFTLSIWVPRSSVYYCRGDAAPSLEGQR